MSFYVVDYKGCTAENGKQGKIVFTGRTERSASKWLEENQTEADLAVDRYALDMDPDTYRRWEARKMREARA